MKRILAAALCSLLVLAACGDDDDAVGTGDTTTTAPETRQPSTDAGEVPERIVSLGPSGTEILFAIGAGDQVVAVDDQSDFPPDVPVTDLSSYQPSVEAVAAYEPDLVVITGAVPPEALTAFDTVGIEVLYLDAPTELEQVYEQFRDIGIATGHEDEAADLVNEVQGEIDELVAHVPERAAPLTYYHELDDQLYSITSATFLGQLYALAGLESIADAADPDGSLGGYPQLSAELIVEADPDFVFLADTECCGQTPDTFAARPGFGDLTAVGKVVQLDDDIASRWGPRIVDFLETVIDATT